MYVNLYIHAQNDAIHFCAYIQTHNNPTSCHLIAQFEQEFDGKNIPKAQLDRVLPLLASKNFTPEKMKKRSKAAANLCSWVVNIIAYHQIYVNTKPLMESLDAAHKANDDAVSNLRVVEGVVSGLMAEMKTLEAAFLEATNKKTLVEADAQRNKDRLDLAQRVTVGLRDEYNRWGEEIESIQQDQKNTVGDAVLGASFLTYSGAFNAQFRKKMMNGFWSRDVQERGIPVTIGPQGVYDPLQSLTSELEITRWVSEGLNMDRFSVENGTICTNSVRWPLLIDPQMQAIRWLTNRTAPERAAPTPTHQERPKTPATPGPGGPVLVEEAEEGEVEESAGEGATVASPPRVRSMSTLSTAVPIEASEEEEEEEVETKIHVIQLGQPDCWSIIREAVVGGHVVVIENVDEQLSNELRPLLKRAVVQRGPNLYLQLQNGEVEYNQNFRLFLQTRLANPHYLPEITGECTIIDFTVTSKGLQDQLLSQVRESA